MTKATGQHSLQLNPLDYFENHANELDETADKRDIILDELVKTGAIAIGVGENYGGSGGTICDSVEAVAALAYHSLTAAFVLWGQKTYAHFLVASDNHSLCAQQLPKIMNGSLAGASALSNAMKFMAGLEPLQIQAKLASNGKIYANGVMPWVTNVRQNNFVVAAAIERADKTAFVACFNAADHGLSRSADLDLTALRASNTAAIDLKDVAIDESAIIFDDLATSIAPVRPGFIGMQCAMSLGLIRRSLDETQHNNGAGRAILNLELDEVNKALARLKDDLLQGLETGQFIANIGALFAIRIKLSDLVIKAIWLELQSLGGKAYVQKSGAGFGRRLKEAAFIPIITPSIVQLKSLLARQSKP